jgi:Zn-dependent protease with chaperone function
VTWFLGWLRGLLAVGLLAGFYVLTLVLVAADAVFVGLALWAAFNAPTPSSNWALVVGGSIPAVAALLYGLATVSRAEDKPPGAVYVRRREAPGLWRLVEDLAEQMRTRPPSRIYLTPEANASVSEDARWLGFAVGERAMYIGVPLLMWLKPGELRAVLCHELGHYAGRHTRFGAVTYRGAASLSSTLFRLRMTAQSRDAIPSYAWYFKLAIGAYAWVYLRISLAVRRRQEFEADAEAVAAVGPATTAHALRAAHALGAAWTGFLERYVRPVQRLGFVPDDLFEAFDAMATDPQVQRRLAALREHPIEANRSPLDSHPPLLRRLALIEAQPAGEPRPVDDEPLFANRAPVLRVQRTILAEAGCQATSLPVAKWTDLAAEAFAIEPASLLLDAARAVAGTGGPTLRTVLDLLEQGEGRELARRLTDRPEPEQQLAEALYALVGQALAGAGLGRWVLSWTKGYLLVCLADAGRDLEDLVAAAAADGSAVGELRDELLRLGLDIELPVPMALRTVSAPAGRTAGVRITASVPDFVAEEVKRQRTVRNVTMVLLLILAVPWGITMFSSNGTDRSSPVGVNAWESGPNGGQVWPPNIPPANPLPAPPRADRAPDVTRLLPSFAPPSLRAYLLIVIEPGDTLATIACRYGTTVQDLQELNDLGSSTEIYAGETMIVPPAAVGTTEPGCR